MQKGQAVLWIVIGVLIIALITGGAYYLGKSQGPKPQNPVVTSQTTMPSITPSAMPTPDEISNFNFIFKYGVSSNPGGPRNIINISNQTYTKDMVSGQDVTTKLSLTEDEKKLIIHKMLSINLFDFPDNFSPAQSPCKLQTMQTPYSSYDLTVVHGSIIKHLSWDDQFTCKDNPNLQVEKLRQLSQFIIDVIESKSEYKNLPAARGGYL